MPMDIFSAIADPTRRNIVEMLASNDHLSAAEICENFQISNQAISQHLKILREANVVSVEKSAQKRIYRLNTKAMAELEAWSKNRCGWLKDKFGLSWQIIPSILGKLLRPLLALFTDERTSIISPSE